MFSSDRDYMREALTLAAKARPISPPNPSVGCVIVRDGSILGEGFTQKVGSDHAEIQAIKDAAANGHDVKGVDEYVLRSGIAVDHVKGSAARRERIDAAHTDGYAVARRAAGLVDLDAGDLAD